MSSQLHVQAHVRKGFPRYYRAMGTENTLNLHLPFIYQLKQTKTVLNYILIFHVLFCEFRILKRKQTVC